MVDRRTTYIDPTYVPCSQPKMIAGVTFRLYRTENRQYAMISDDGQIMVKRGYNLVSYTAYVLPTGPIYGPGMQPKRFRNEDRACADAVDLLKQIQTAQNGSAQ